jgi:hypothetical protein
MGESDHAVEHIAHDHFQRNTLNSFVFQTVSHEDPPRQFHLRDAPFIGTGAVNLNGGGRLTRISHQAAVQVQRLSAESG